MNEERADRGQSVVEIAVILPVLLVLLYGVVEVGFGLRNYLIVANANREAARFAARGRYDNDDFVVERVVGAGGTERRGGADVPFLRTVGPDPNTGVIVTHIDIGSDYSAGDPITPTVYLSGVVPSEAGVRPIQAADSVISVTTIIQLHGPATQSINATRVLSGYAALSNHILVVETFYMHHPIASGMLGLLPVPDPWPMYAQTEMRVVTDRR